MKRLIALVCIICAAASLFTFTGCGGDEGTELLWYIPGDAQPDQEAVMTEVNKILKEKLGVTLNIQFIPTSAYAERMKMTMASGKEYDLCFTSNWLNYYDQAVDNEALYDITEFVEKDKSIYDVVPETIMNGIKKDGKIYGIPNMQILVSPLAVWARKDLLEKYDFDLQSVEKITDIEPFLASVKAGETDIFPFRTKWGPAMWVNAKNWGECSACGIWYNYDTLEFKPWYEVPEYQEYIEDFRDWYRKGYIRKDQASVGDDSTDSKQNKYAVQMAGYKPGQKTPDNQTNCEYDYKVLFTLPMNAGAGAATMTAVSATSQNPEKAYELIKLMNTDKELYNLVCNGIEGKHYELTEEGKIIPDPESGYHPDSDWMFGCQFNALIDEGMDDDVWEQTIALNATGVPSPSDGLSYDDSETGPAIANLRAIMDEYSDFMTPADYDAYLAKYKKAMEEAGMKEVYADIEKQYKAHFKENGIKPKKK